MENCSVKKEKLSAFAEMRMLPAEETELVNHLFKCESCQHNLRDIYDSLVHKSEFKLLEGEKNELKQIVLNHVKQLKLERNYRRTGWLILENLTNVKPAALAAADDQTADQKLLKSALATNSLSFVAILDKNHSDYWKATFPIPSAPNPEMELSIEITDVEGQAIQTGILIFCGIEVPVEEGWCYIKLKDLQDNINKQSIAFRHTNGNQVQGRLPNFYSDDIDY